MSRVGSNFSYVCITFCPLPIGRAGARKTRRLITLLSVGWVPPSLHPSGACLTLGTRIPCGLLTLPRVTPNRGCASSDGRWNPGELLLQLNPVFRGHSHLLGNCPHEGAQFSGNGDHDLIGIFAFGHQLMAWITVGSFSRRSCR